MILNILKIIMKILNNNKVSHGLIFFYLNKMMTIYMNYKKRKDKNLNKKYKKRIILENY